MEKTEGNLHWQIVQNLMEGFDEDRALTEIADDICSLLSQRIKADATDFDALCCDGCYKITEKMTTAEADVYCLNCTLKAVAASQLQAVLGELE